MGPAMSPGLGQGHILHARWMCWSLSLAPRFVLSATDSEQSSLFLRWMCCFCLQQWKGTWTSTNIFLSFEFV